MFKKALKDILHIALAVKDSMRENVSSFLVREFICAKCKDTYEPVINQEQFDREKKKLETDQNSMKRTEISHGFS